MPEYSQSEIDELIACRKNVSYPPRRQPRLVGADYRNDVKLIASNGDPGEFSVFMRRNEDFPENFSIGMTYQPQDGRQEITLLRCNGKHGVFNSDFNFNPDHPHWDFHIHKADSALLESGLKPERQAVKTDAYASYEEAIPYFLKAVNLDEQDIAKHFPREFQSNLFTPPEKAQ